MPMFESAILLGLVKGLGLKGLLAKLGLVIKAGTAKTIVGKAGVDAGVLLGLAGGAVVKDVLFEKSSDLINMKLKSLGYDFTINPVALKSAWVTLAGIDQDTFLECVEESLDGSLEEIMSIALHKVGDLDSEVAAALSVALVQISSWLYEAQQRR